MPPMRDDDNEEMGGAMDMQRDEEEEDRDDVATMDQDAGDGDDVVGADGRKRPRAITEEESRRRIVDVSRGVNRVWLVKLPSFLMDYWRQVPSRTHLGSISIGTADAGSGVAPVSLSVVQDLTTGNGAAPAVPGTYTVKFTSNPPGNMLVFTEDGQGYGQTIEGTVQHECNVVPIIDDDYRQIMRQRREEAERPRRTTQYYEHSGKNRMVHNVVGKFFAQNNPAATAKRRKMEDIRKDRLPREELIEIIFKAFETHPHWSLKGLVEHTKQPTAYVKELLTELCVYIQRGPYKSLYQIKDEYRSQAASTAAPSSSG